MTSSGEFALELAMLQGASIADALAIAVTRDSERVLAAIADEELCTAKTLRPVVTVSGFAASCLDDNGRGESQ